MKILTSILDRFPKVIFKNGKTEIRLLKEAGALCVTANGFQSSLQYRKQALAQLKALKKYNLHRIVYDLRTTGVISQEDQQWTLNIWQPQAKEIGVDKTAIVVPENVFGQLTVEAVMETEQTREVTWHKYFKTLEEAIEWVGEND